MPPRPILCIDPLRTLTALAASRWVSGLVRSLNQPGGNATGVADVAVDLGGKRLGLLHELLPGAMRFALLVTPATTTGESTIAEVKSAAVAIMLGKRYSAQGPRRVLIS